MATWWSQERIEKTVNEKYVEQELGSKRHQDTLHRVLAFGDGLTDDTYLDWILERSPRFFLILNDIGVPEKIFEIIDRSFDDDDLPLSQDGLWELNLFGTPSETLDKKFYRQQFHFLIHEIEPGGHVDYGAWDVVPLEPSLRKSSMPATVLSTDRVYAHSHLYTRKKIPASGEKGLDKIRFIMHLKSISALQHRHLVTVWATYSQHDYNYVLLTPPCDVTLRHILEDKDMAKQFKCLEKHDRRRTLLTWMHCLTSALAYLHSRGFMHKSIRPSTINIDHNNNIYLDDYNALRVLDVEESPNPYSGEIYEYSPPENWLRKPTLHETAPLRTTLPGGGRTSRRLPKSNIAEAESRRPSLIGHDAESRPYSRSQNSSSGSSTTCARPRNALITTFAPPEMAPISLPNKYYPADIFSLTAVNITIISFLLGHSPKSFASHRCRLNRQAGRGNAPPDASFHKNLKQVEKWLSMLEKEAGQKEKKDQSMWGGVVELVKLCREGLTRDPEDRIKADDLEKKTLGWVNFSISQNRKCECCEDDHSLAEPNEPNPVVRAQRDSVLSWSRISERISSGLYTNDTPTEYVERPRRSLSKRLTLDRAPELRRPRWSRHSAAYTNTQTLSSQSDDPPLSPKSFDTTGRQQSEKIRQAVQTAVSSTAIKSQIRKPEDFTIIHQGRSAYRIKPNKKTPSHSSLSTPLSSPRRSTHPIPPPICEEEPSPYSNHLHNSDLQSSARHHEDIDSNPSAYTLSPPLRQPRRQTHPIPSTSGSTSASTSGSGSTYSSSISSRRRPYPRPNPIDARVIEGINPSPSHDSIITANTVDIWGLGNALEEEVDGILGGWEVNGWEGTGIASPPRPPIAERPKTSHAGVGAEKSKRAEHSSVRKVKSKGEMVAAARAKRQEMMMMRGADEMPATMVDWPLPPMSVGSVGLTSR